MSTSSVIDATAVDSNPPRWSVVLLTVVTLGIYGIVWYFTINRELRDFGAAHGDADLGSSEPWRSVVAVTLGAVLVVRATGQLASPDPRCRPQNGLRSVLRCR